MKIMVLAPSRVRLEASVGQKLTVVAIYWGMGTRRVGRREFRTVLIREVREASTGALLTDHLWFNRGNTWRKAGLLPGDMIEFEARSIEYRPGHWGPDLISRLENPPRVDYKLTPPTGIRKLGRDTGERTAA